MNRYFFSAALPDGENANAFIDAADPNEASRLYRSWATRVLGELPAQFKVWQLPAANIKACSLDWERDILEVYPS